MSAAVRRAQAQPFAATIAALEWDYGSTEVAAVLGDGVKRLAPSEAANYRRTNRSLHAMRAIGRGEVFGRDNTAVLRTEKVLRPGIDPEFLALALGRRAERDIPCGEGIEWEDLGGPALPTSSSR